MRKWARRMNEVPKCAKITFTRHTQHSLPYLKGIYVHIYFAEPAILCLIHIALLSDLKAAIREMGYMKYWFLPLALILGDRTTSNIALTNNLLHITDILSINLFIERPFWKAWYTCLHFDYITENIVILDIAMAHSTQVKPV